MRDIVLVHSNQKLSDLYSQRLNTRFRVKTAFDGLSGLRLIKQANPHIVVTEYELPWLSGIALLKFVRRHPTMSRTPVIIISQSEPVASALNYGANEWIRPSEVSLDEMLQKIYYHLITNKIIK